MISRWKVFLPEFFRPTLAGAAKLLLLEFFVYTFQCFGDDHHPFNVLGPK